MSSKLFYRCVCQHLIEMSTFDRNPPSKRYFSVKLRYTFHRTHRTDSPIHLVVCHVDLIREQLVVPDYASAACLVAAGLQVACGVGRKLISRLERATGLRCWPYQSVKACHWSAVLAISVDWSLPLTCGVGRISRLERATDLRCWPAVLAISIT